MGNTPREKANYWSGFFLAWGLAVILYAIASEYIKPLFNIGNVTSALALIALSFYFRKRAKK